MPVDELQAVRLAYEIKGDGEPLLLIHGLGSSQRDWQRQVPCFAERYRVITVDLRGHGKSDRPPTPYSIPLFARDIAGLVRTLELGAVHVLGLSLGGFIAFELAVEHADLVRSLVVVNSAPGLPRDRLRDRLQIAWGVFLRKLILRLFGMRALGQFLGNKLFPQPDQQQLRQQLVERWAQNDADAYLASLAATCSWNPVDRLGSITCPTCVISGEHDLFPLALKQRYTAKLPNARLVVIPDSMHFTPLDQPERFNHTVMAFLGGLAEGR